MFNLNSFPMMVAGFVLMILMGSQVDAQPSEDLSFSTKVALQDEVANGGTVILYTDVVDRQNLNRRLYAKAYDWTKGNFYSFIGQNGGVPGRMAAISYYLDQKKKPKKTCLNGGLLPIARNSEDRIGEGSLLQTEYRRQVQEMDVNGKPQTQVCYYRKRKVTGGWANKPNNCVPYASFREYECLYGAYSRNQKQHIQNEIEEEARYAIPEGSSE